MTLGILLLVVTALIIVVVFMLVADRIATAMTLLLICAAITAVAGLYIMNMNRERTTLQITYKDSVAVDSVVVYK